MESDKSRGTRTIRRSFLWGSRSQPSDVRMSQRGWQVRDAQARLSAVDRPGALGIRERDSSSALTLRADGSTSQARAGCEAELCENWM